MKRNNICTWNPAKRKNPAEPEGGIAFLETGGYTHNRLRNRFENGFGHWGCLKPSHNWFIETPVMFKLRGGVVVEVETYQQP